MLPALIVAIVLIILVVLVVLDGVFTVRQQTYKVVERFGQFTRIAGPGLNFKIPFIDRIAGEVSMRLQELNVRVATKTKDNVFVDLQIAVQYMVATPEAVWAAFYKLTNPQGQMESYIFDVVRAAVPGMTLDDVFENKEDIAREVKAQLDDQMGEYGYTIIKALVNDIRPADNVIAAMNQINAAQRLRTAAEYEAEAERIRVVKAAEADAESKRLSGEGIANQRKAIVEGYKESVEALSTATGVEPREVMAMVAMTQYFDALREMASSGKSNIIFVQHSPGQVGDMQRQMLEAMVAANPNLNGPGDGHAQTAS